MAKVLTVVLLVLLIGVGVGYFLLARQHSAELELQRQHEDAAVIEEREAGMALTLELAQDMTRMLASMASSLVVLDDRQALDDLLAGAVQGNRLVGIIVLGAEGEVLSSTDLRYRGRTLDDRPSLIALAAEEPIVADEAPAAGQVEVAAPLLAGGQRLGAVRAFFDLGERTEP